MVTVMDIQKYALILLAAGNSIRYEGNKLLDVIDGKPMYRYICDEVCELSMQKIIVTQYEQIAEYGRNHGFKVIYNPNPERGISGSIRLGVESANKAEGYLFAVCDQPNIKKESIINIVRLAEKTSKGIVASVVSCKGREHYANPNFFSAKYRQELLELTGDRGGKQIIKKHSNDVAKYRITDVEAQDIDFRI